MKLKRKRSLFPRTQDSDPKVMALETAVIKNRIAKAAVEDLEAVKTDLKLHVFPFGEPAGEASWRFKFPENHRFAGVAITYTERVKPRLDPVAAERILKSKKLFSKCFTTPEPPPPPPPYLDEEKILQFLSEGKLTKAEVKQMIKVSKADTVKAITITDPECEKKSAKPKTRKKA